MSDYFPVPFKDLDAFEALERAYILAATILRLFKRGQPFIHLLQYLVKDVLDCLEVPGQHQDFEYNLQKILLELVTDLNLAPEDLDNLINVMDRKNLFILPCRKKTGNTRCGSKGYSDGKCLACRKCPNCMRRLGSEDINVHHHVICSPCHELKEGITAWGGRIYCGGTRYYAGKCLACLASRPCSKCKTRLDSYDENIDRHDKCPPCRHCSGSVYENGECLGHKRCSSCERFLGNDYNNESGKHTSCPQCRRCNRSAYEKGKCLGCKQCDACKRPLGKDCDNDSGKHTSCPQCDICELNVYEDGKCLGCRECSVCGKRLNITDRNIVQHEECPKCDECGFADYNNKQCRKCCYICKKSITSTIIRGDDGKPCHLDCLFEHGKLWPRSRRHRKRSMFKVCPHHFSIDWFSFTEIVKAKNFEYWLSVVKDLEQHVADLMIKYMPSLIALQLSGQLPTFPVHVGTDIIYTIANQMHCKCRFLHFVCSIDLGMTEDQLQQFFRIQYQRLGVSHNTPYEHLTSECNRRSLKSDCRFWKYARKAEFPESVKSFQG
jgi:hypothetical protein